mgnify:CR=1 FL=1
MDLQEILEISTIKTTQEVTMMSETGSMKRKDGSELKEADLVDEEVVE